MTLEASKSNIGHRSQNVKRKLRLRHRKSLVRTHEIGYPFVLYQFLPNTAVPTKNSIVSLKEKKYEIHRRTRARLDRRF